MSLINELRGWGFIETIRFKLHMATYQQAREREILYDCVKSNMNYVSCSDDGLRLRLMYL